MRKWMPLAVVLVWLLVVFSGIARAASGDLDGTFSGDGRALASLGAGDSDAWDVAVQSDGKAVAVGAVRLSTTNWDWGLVRYKPNGTLDPSFGNGGDGKVTTGWTSGDDEAYAVKILPSGKILVAGQAGSDVGLARYTSTGHLDSTFGGGDGKVVVNITPQQDAGWDIELLSKGKFLVGGDAGDDAVVMTFGPKGGLVTSFGGGDGFGTLHSHNGSLEGRELAVAPNGKILLTGFIFGTSSFALILARFTSAGQPDTTFGGSHEGLAVELENRDSEGWGILPLDGGSVLVVGYGRNDNPEDSPYDAAVLKFTSDGELDPSYGGGDGVVFADLGGDLDYVLAMAPLPSGKMLVAGSSADIGLGSDGVVARLKQNGTLDHTFSGDGVSETNFPGSSAQLWGVAVAPSNKIVATGYAVFSGNPDKFGTARFLG